MSPARYRTAPPRLGSADGDLRVSVDSHEWLPPGPWDVSELGRGYFLVLDQPVGVDATITSAFGDTV